MWAVMVGDTGMVESSALAYSPMGNLFMSGAFTADTDFDPGPGVYMLNKVGARNPYVLNVDLNGNFVWARSFGGTSNYVQLMWCAADQAGNVVMSSSFSGTMDTDPGPGVQNFFCTNTTHPDVYIIKLNPSGNLVWARQLASASDESILSIACDQAGNVLATGYYINTLDCDPGVGTFNIASNAGSHDIFLLKLDMAGNFMWAKSYGSQAMEHPKSVVTDASNNVLLSGSFSYTVDFDAGPGVYNLTSTSAPNAPDLFVVKLDPAGEFVWARNWVHSGCGYGFCINIDRDDAVYMTGNFKGTFDVDPGTGNYTLTTMNSVFAHFFILKLDAFGNFMWGVSSGGTSHVYGYAITIDKYYNVYTNGSFDGTTDFDPDAPVFNISAANTYSFYMHKLKQNLNIGMPENNPADALRIYPNPGSGVFNIVGNEIADAITITGAIGRVVMTLKPQTENVPVDLGAFSDGVYFVRVSSENRIKTTRIILQR